MKELIRLGIRRNAIFIPNNLLAKDTKINNSTTLLVGNLAKLGFGFSEDLLYSINALPPSYKLNIYQELSKILGTNKNWTPLVKGWENPTGENIIDHLITLLVNTYDLRSGLRLACGHYIPENTFPMERYNGCPFCGTPFQFGELESFGKGSKLKVLELWTEQDVQSYFADLLQSKTALDATQIDTLKVLIKNIPLPEVPIAMKETLMVVIDFLIEEGKGEEASLYLTTPVDIMRYLWYKQTGFLQIIEPSVLIKNAYKNQQDIRQFTHKKSVKAALDYKNTLKLKYSRTQSKIVACWLNKMEMSPERICEAMHPKRNMWVRFIRALRLAEYSKRKGFEQLREIMDLFYNQLYEVWAGRVNYYRLRSDSNKTFELLKQRPGLFARSLFSNMLWFGAEETIDAFSSIVKQVPARLLVTLNMYAQLYFDKQPRSVKPLGSTTINVAPNKYLDLYTSRELEQMKSMIADLCLGVIMERFAEQKNENKTIYIDPKLFGIPLAIGDRSSTVQDLPTALPGTRFEIEGHNIRLFMQWGKGMPAQYLDMDLSCAIVYNKTIDYCNFSRLHTTGAKHSGDIQSIPNEIGTAEYIELDIELLRKAKAEYVVFTSNAYSAGGLCPNLVVGWMDSKYKMQVSERTGVAYDPSCVQQQVRVIENSKKGLVFGVLDLSSREIIWMEMNFGGQVVQNLDIEAVEALIAKLNSKLNIGEVLRMKALAQNLKEISTPDADENYTQHWARNTAAVTQLLLLD